MSDMVCIREFWTREEAEVAASLLESAGILALIQADDLGGWIPIQFGKSAVRLFVSQSDAQSAKHLLHEEIEEHAVVKQKGKHWAVTGLKYYVFLFIIIPFIIMIISFFLLVLRGCQ